MKVYQETSSYTNNRPSVVTIGTFDGVHIGHKEIINQLVKTAQEENLDSVVLTFFPHPRMVLQKESNIKLINTIGERKDLLAKTELDHLIIHSFTKEFSRITALEFVRDILVNKLKAKKVIIGYDHRFGRNRAATIDDLKEFGETFDFEVIEIGARQLDEVSVSSTKVRRAIEEGDCKTAHLYLGYPFMLTGTVVKGKSIGKTLNFPTANLHVQEAYKIVPKIGVYVVQSIIANKKVFGITNIGTNPTVGGINKTIETFFLDFNEVLYDQELQIAFLTRIRGEINFDSVEELKQAIQEDEKFARAYLKLHE
ncbi:MAG: riboflavin kinase/FMN adenylyltransferase [Flavobacteriaceae bacterium]|uniref:bifunctional riboflavin kinase/FAD synthetase n=1 Tax=Candidatus Marifrigoribacter sp. Uisw_064 TaxID=3230970 RepID=UPI003AE2B3BD